MARCGRSLVAGVGVFTLACGAEVETDQSSHKCLRQGQAETQAQERGLGWWTVEARLWRTLTQAEESGLFPHQSVFLKLCPQEVLPF